MGKMDYYDDLYLSITFAYTGYTSKTNNIIDSLAIYPENYVGFSFAASKSSKTTQKNNGRSTLFSFPMRSKNDISISSIALLDSTYPQKNEHVTGGIDYKVPLIFEFIIDEDALNSEIANSSIKYSVTFSLSKEEAN